MVGVEPPHAVGNTMVSQSPSALEATILGIWNAASSSAWSSNNGTQHSTEHTMGSQQTDICVSHNTYLVASVENWVFGCNFLARGFKSKNFAFMINQAKYVDIGYKVSEEKKLNGPLLKITYETTIRGGSNNRFKTSSSLFLPFECSYMF